LWSQVAIEVDIRSDPFVHDLAEGKVYAHLLNFVSDEDCGGDGVVALDTRADEGAGLETPTIVSACVVDVVPGSIDVVIVVDMIDDKLDIVGPSMSALRGDDLSTITVVVGVGAIKDSEARGRGVVSAKLGHV
jgi:hypothetical protein